MRIIYVAAILIILLLLQPHASKGVMVYQEKSEKWRNKIKGLMLESSQKGQNPSTGASGCTFIPGEGSSACPDLFRERHFAQRLFILPLS